ncbi:MAG: murein biosynthesis integral membrane protein MurJ [Spirochaetales bacterium]|nr:murein biosynthesis integral membrane protein MurJ [Spirochaetales bacterium]
MKQVKKETKIQRTGFTSIIVMICTLTTRLFGVVRNVLINYFFGGDGFADVWHLVFMVPNNLRKLFAEGALSSAFIPVLSSALVTDSTGENSRKISRNIFTFQLIVLIPVVLIAIVFAPQIMNVLALFPRKEKMELAVTLFRWIFGYILFVSISAILMGVLNSHNIFIPPAIMPLLFSVTVIGSIVLFHTEYGIMAMVPGIIAGGIAQIVFLLPYYFREGYDFRPDIHFNNPAFRQVMKLWLPILAASSIFTVNQQVAMIFASGLEDGSASAIGNALVFFQLPFGMITSSISTVLFPRMSRQATLSDTDGLRSTFEYGLNFILIFLLPALVGYCFLGRHIIALIFQHGKFTVENTLLTYDVLWGYSLGLFSLGAFMFCQRFFYSLKDYKTPGIISLFVVALDIALSFWLKETFLRVTGLAVANSIAFTAGFAVMLVCIRKRLKRLGGKRLLRNLLKTSFAMAIVSGVIILYLFLTSGCWTPGNSPINGLLVTGAVIAAAGVTFFLYYITGIDIFRGILKERFRIR